MAQAEMQVTPEEARFIRRFFRRQALPWMVVLGVLAIAASRWAVPAADPDLARELAETRTMLEAVRAENATLRTQLDAVGQRIQAAVDRRIGAAEGRIAAIEKLPRARTAEASGVTERLARVEERLAAAASAQDTVTRSSLSRLKDLEARMLSVEGLGSSMPAAPAP